LLLVRYGTSEALPSLACQGTVSVALGRLPQIEANASMLQEALASFDRCLGAPDGVALPIPVLLGLKTRIALLLLERARATSGGKKSVSPAALADINKAHVLLATVREDMATPITSQFASRLSLAPLEPQAKSLLTSLPRVHSDPRLAAGFANSRTVSSVLAAVTLWLQAPGLGPASSTAPLKPFSAQFAFREQPQGKHNTAAAAVARLVEWGCRLEVNPGPDLVYILARALMDAGVMRVGVISSLLKQSHRLCQQDRGLAGEPEGGSALRFCHSSSAPVLPRPKSSFSKSAWAATRATAPARVWRCGGRSSRASRQTFGRPSSTPSACGTAQARACSRASAHSWATRATSTL